MRWRRGDGALRRVELAPRAHSDPRVHFVVAGRRPYDHEREHEHVDSSAR